MERKAMNKEIFFLNKLLFYVLREKMLIYNKIEMKTTFIIKLA